MSGAAAFVAFFAVSRAASRAPAGCRHDGRNGRALRPVQQRHHRSLLRGTAVVTPIGLARFTFDRVFVAERGFALL
jgi:hypothetical protein